MSQQHLDRLTAIDASFLHQEGPTSHMHVGAVMIFEGPPPGYVDFVNQVRGRLHFVPRYRQKLAFPPLDDAVVRVFVDEGLPTAALLEKVIRERRDDGSYNDSPDGAPDVYAGRLLEHFALQADSGNGGPRSGRTPGLEPLSGREVEVLELVAAGRSNAEIAGELYLSVGTVKAHVHHIFGKLLVRNRSQAVARARELRLLD